MKERFIAFIKKPVVSIIVSALALGGAGAFAYSHLKSAAPDQEALVERGDITETVALTGSVVSKSKADLSFAANGRIRGVYHASGEHVGAGALIASIDTSDLEASRVQAEASLLIEEAKLADMKSGTDSAYDRSSTALLNAAQDAYAKADDAIRNYADYFYSNPTVAPDFGVTVQAGGTTLVFGEKDYDRKTKLDSERASMETLMTGWHDAIVKSASPDEAAFLAKQNLEAVRQFLNDVALSVDAFTATDLAYQSSVDAMKAKISTARSMTSAALSALIAAQNMRPNDAARSIQEAQVVRAQATISGIDAQIAKAEIRAPFSGTLAKNDAHAGEIAVPNIPVATVVADGYTVEAYASEADVAKLTVGDAASLTLDAYGSGTPLAGIVRSVDTASSAAGGVDSYKVVISLESSVAPLSDGMQAAVTVKTGVKSGVLLVPASAIVRRKDSYIVLVKGDDVPVERSVVPGITDGAHTEIISGVSEGERIITFGN